MRYLLQLVHMRLQGILYESVLLDGHGVAWGGWGVDGVGVFQWKGASRAIGGHRPAPRQ